MSQDGSRFGFEALHRLHQTHVSLGYNFADRQAIAPVTHCNLGNEPQMAGDELMRGFRVGMLKIPLGEHILFLRLKHGEASDFFQITGQPTVTT